MSDPATKIDQDKNEKLDKLKQYMEDSEDEDGEYDWGDGEDDSDEEELDLNEKLMLSAAKQAQHEHDQEWARDVDEKSLQQEAEQRHRERQIRIKIEPYLKQLDLLKDAISNRGDVTDLDIDMMEMCRGIMSAHKDQKIMENVVASRIAGHMNYLFDYILKVNHSEMSPSIEPLIHLLRACVKVSTELQESLLYCGVFPRIYEHLRLTRNRDSLLALVLDFCSSSELGVKLFIGTGGIQEVILPFIAKGSHYLDICLGLLSHIQCLPHAALVSNLLNHDPRLIDVLTQILIDLAFISSSDNRRRIENIIQININLYPTQNSKIIKQFIGLLQDHSKISDHGVLRSLFTYLQSMTFNSKTALQMVAQGLLHVMVENQIFHSPILDHVMSVLYNHIEKCDKQQIKFPLLHPDLKSDCSTLMDKSTKSLLRAQAKSVFSAL